MAEQAEPAGTADDRFSWSLWASAATAADADDAAAAAGGGDDDAATGRAGQEPREWRVTEKPWARWQRYITPPRKPY